MSELKVGDVVSYRQMGTWFAGPVNYINNGTKNITAHFTIGSVCILFDSDVEWEKGFHESLIPEGFAIVPVEPTDEMLSHAQVMCGASHPDYEFDYKECWASMINAAPKPTDK